MRNKGIAIELTSLLDVILIMMFMLLIKSEKQVTTANTLASESNAAKEEMMLEFKALEEENGHLRRVLNRRVIVEENSCVISINVKPNEDNRAISVEIMGNKTEHISLNWENRNYVTNELYALLTKKIAESEAQVVFIIFEYDRNDIYQSDYTLITDIILRLKQNPHVYTMEYDVSMLGDYHVQ